MEPDSAEIRVLGCLLEKQRTTPDAYPLTLNALRLACNQSTNRDPVVAYDGATVRDAVRHLAGRRWARVASGAGSRAPKYRHLLDDALGLSAAELSLLAVLMLRGPQTPGELKQRVERMHPFAGLDEVREALDGLIDRGHAARLERRPGEKQERYRQTLGGDTGGPSELVAGPPAEPAPAAEAEAEAGDLAMRVARLEREVEALQAEIERLRAPAGGFGRD